MTKWDLIKPLLALVHLGLMGFLVLQGVVMSRQDPHWSLARFIRSSVVVFAAFVSLELAAFGYVRFVEPNWIMITRLRVHDTDLARALGRARIVQITDLHIDRFGFRERQMIWQVNRHHPDWIVITGDLINRREGWPVALEVIRRLRATHGIWVVPGNTDNLFLTPQQFEQGLEGIGARVLRNARVPMGETGAWLVGVDDPVERHDRLDRALAGLELAARSSVILLAHSPDIMPSAVRERIPLVLVGHTHGGQLGIKWIRQLSSYAERGPYMSGRFQQGDTLLYVNRGIGSKVLPYRFLAPPEVTVVEFRPSTQARHAAVATPAVSQEAWLGDFETDAELTARWETRGVMATRSEAHATHGRFSAALAFEDGVAPAIGIERTLEPRDWTGFTTLSFDIYNDQSSPERIILQLKDDAGHFYKEDVVIPAHASQHVTVPLLDVTPYLDLADTTSLRFFRWRPGRAATFYVDAIKLERLPRL